MRRGRARGGHGHARKIELTIAELEPGGAGVAIEAIDGERRAIFVDGVVPGERVAVEVDVSRRPARGRLLAVIQPARSRVEPVCKVVDRCGGCDWMHLSGEARLAAHAAMIERVLPNSTDVPVSVSVEGSTQDVGYRSRARVHVEARRGPTLVGMFGRRSRDPAPVETCVVLHPTIEALRTSLASLLAGARGRGEALLSLGHPDVTPRRPVLDLRWQHDSPSRTRSQDALPPRVFSRLEDAVRAGTLAGARVWDGAVSVPATIGDPTPWIRGADGAPLRLAPGGFSQASEEGNTRLGTRVAELASELSAPGANVLELYAGAGNLTVLLARDQRVVAVEADADACTAARDNLAERGLSARVVTADAAERAAASLDKSVRLVVLDPPRTGARDVARALASSPVPAVIYVSCDPPTLGRDLATLVEGGYTLTSISAVEMFPQTSHVETIAALVRRGTKPGR